MIPPIIFKGAPTFAEALASLEGPRGGERRGESGTSSSGFGFRSLEERAGSDEAVHAGPSTREAPSTVESAWEEGDLTSEPDEQADAVMAKSVAEDNFAQISRPHTQLDLHPQSSALESVGMRPASAKGRIGAPPDLAFRLEDLVSLADARACSTNEDSASVLACIKAMSHFETRGSTRYEWLLVDTSGQEMPLVIWAGELGQDDAQNARLGDIVVVKAAFVDSSWSDGPTLSYRSSTRIRICWRAALIEPRDSEMYRFHRDWANTIPEAAAVIAHVDYSSAHLI